MTRHATPSRAPHPNGLAVIELRPHDDLASLGRRLARVDRGRVALLLPWDLPFLSRELDYDLLRREASRHRLDVAIVSPDPLRRQIAHGSGFPTFATPEAAAAADRWNGRGRRAAEPPPTYWWEEEEDLMPRAGRPAPTWLGRLKDGVRYLAFFLVTLVLAASAYAIIPTAEITLVPAGQILTVRVPVSVDPEVESVIYTDDGAGGIVPSRRVGLEVEGHAEVATSETATVAAGRAKGEVLFTSRLAQDYVVPAGTVVRTSSTSYPIRFRTTADVVVPAEGQAKAPIEALDERTGNVGAYQINRVEGVAASAVRVINPEATTGAEGKEVAVVVQEDYDRVREQLTGQLLDQAYGELHGLLEPDEFLPYQSLRVEAVPKKAYSHFIGEQAETIGLNMRLLVSGQAVDAEAARGVARRVLLNRLPPGYRLVESQFQVGDLVEGDEGPGLFTFYVTGRGYAAAAIGEDEVIAQIRGQRVADARAELEEAFPLAKSPQFETWPNWPDWLAWLDRVPLVPLRIDVVVEPQVPAIEEGAALPPDALSPVPVRPT
jgi:hypothetical protein